MAAPALHDAPDDNYPSFYNPGGPGPEPFPDNSPASRDIEPITNALDNRIPASTHSHDEDNEKESSQP